MGFSRARDEVPILRQVVSTQKAECYRCKLARWAREHATEGGDYVVDNPGDRTYRTAALRQFVIPYLKELNLEVRDENKTTRHLLIRLGKEICDVPEPRHEVFLRE